MFEIIGLAVVVPVINLLVDPTQINKNKIIYYLYNAGGFNNNLSFVLATLIAIGIIFILKNTLLYYILKHQTEIGFSLAKRLATNKYNNYLTKPYLFFSENNTAVLLRNITQLPSDLIVYNIFPFIGLLNEFFILLVIILAMTFYNPLLFLVTIAFAIPFLILFNRVYKGKLKHISEVRDKESSNMYKIGLQSLEGFREITVFNKLDFFKPLFQKSIDSFTKASSSGYFLNIFSPKLVETVAILCLVNIFLFGYIFEENMEALTQFMIVFAIAAYRIIPSINKIILFSNYIKSCSFVFSYFNKDDDDPISKNPKDQIAPIQALLFTDTLFLKNLSFKFKKEDYILNNINLTIKKGENIGIVGPSGSGKSTLLNIFLRLYIEENGGIFVDSIKVDKGNRDQWYKLVSYVPQQMTLIEGTIKENIAFGIEQNKINESLLNKVIELAQLQDFTKNLPNGVNTNIGEKGINISGGQKQRIAIARALYHGGEILIFDEATSALDIETEESLTEAIHSLSNQNLTIIIVSHRYQTLKHCSKIFKLEKGNLNGPIAYNQFVQNHQKSSN